MEHSTFFSRILLVVVLAFVVIFLLPKEKQLVTFQAPMSSPTPNLGTSSFTPSEGDGWKTYIDQELSISFQYPSSFGIVGICDHYDYAKCLAFSSGGIFLHAVNPHAQLPGRGGFWGDAGGRIKSEQSVRDFCGVGSRDCSVYTNTNGVLIAKVKSETCTEGGCSQERTNQYYFYDPHTDHVGVVLSDERFGEDSLNVEDEFARLVDSIKFIALTNWKTYKNTEFGFEFKYPEGWNVSDQNIALDETIYLLGPRRGMGDVGGDQIDFSISLDSDKSYRAGKYLSLPFWIEKNIQFEGFDQETEIGGTYAIRREGVDQISAEKAVAIFFQRWNQVFDFSAVGEENIGVLDRILSTFLFKIPNE